MTSHSSFYIKQPAQRVWTPMPSNQPTPSAAKAEFQPLLYILLANVAFIVGLVGIVFLVTAPLGFFLWWQAFKWAKKGIRLMRSN
jgi:hypothetical protein